MDNKKKQIALIVVLVVVLGVIGYLYKDDILGMLGLSSLGGGTSFESNSNPVNNTPSPAVAPKEQQNNTQAPVAPKADAGQNQNFARSCESGKLDDCSKAIEQFLEAKNAYNALKLAVVACEKKDAKSCTLMSKMYDSEADGLSKVPSLSNAYASLGCEYGDIEACYELGVKYYRGEGGDMKQSFALFKKTCEAGKVEGCNNLAVIYNNGVGGIKKNIKLAKEIFKKACDSGYKPSCDNLAKIK